jgi:cyanophycinase
MNWFRILLLGLFTLPTALPGSSQSPAYRYMRVGNATDAAPTPRPGFALMGGGKDLDEAFRFLCDRSGGGDFLILRATGDDDYNPYIQKLCRLNSVATLILPTPAAASDPFVAKTISHAAALFIAGGDQANYINFWMNTPIQSALNQAIAHGVPIGGTSAGLAVLAEFAYSAQGDKPDDPNLDANTALADPFSRRVTLVRGFLDIPILKGIITDTHFAKRDRMGRLLVFLARANRDGGQSERSSQQPSIRGIGVEERAAVLLEPDGKATVVGKGAAYFIHPQHIEAVIPGKPLSSAEFNVSKVAAARTFDLKAWQGDAVLYTLTVENGAVHSTQANGSIY